MIENIFNLLKSVHNKIDLSNFNLRQTIDIVEWLMSKTYKNIVDDFEVKNEIINGYWARTMTIPEGVLLTGKVHLYEHIFMLISGDLELATDDGSDRLVVNPGGTPIIKVIPSNSKKLGYAHKKSVVVTFHKTELTDFKELVRTLTVDSDLSWVEDLMIEHDLMKDIPMLEKFGVEKCQ